MKTGLNYIVDARNKQLTEGRTIELDIFHNNSNQLITAAHLISNYTIEEADKQTITFLIDLSELASLGWSRHYLIRLLNKPYIERLAIAGALIAAEIDRVLAIEQK